MKGIFRSKYTLIVVYIIMAAICVYLNISAESLDLSNIIVSAALFAIALGLLGYAFVRFTVVDRMISELNDVADTIRDDFSMKKQYLWRYYESRDNLFTGEVLRKRYAEYRAELSRLEMLSGDVYRCDIEDYINQDLIDDTIRRNVLNLISGTMTGLGILGTFIGLTLGLQQFNTGNADQITRSISPLIQGIKVAFHTSIYGMVFSLVFSFIYKNKMDEATEAMDRFLDAYEHYVVPDTKNENQRQMMAFQKTLADGITEIGSSFSVVVADKVNEILTPQMDRMNDTIEKFARVASRTQVEGINAVVDKFIERLDEELDGAFTDLSGAMHETVDWEKENREYMRTTLNEVNTLTTDVARSGELQHEIMEHMAQYIDWLNRINESMNDTLIAVQTQLNAVTMQTAEQQNYMQQYVEYTRQISASSGQYSEEMSKQLAMLQQLDTKIAENASKSMDAIIASAMTAEQTIALSAKNTGDALVRNAQDASDTVSKTTQTQLASLLRSASSVNTNLNDSAQNIINAADRMNNQIVSSLNSTLEAYDKSLVRIVGQLNATTSRIENSTNKVPQIVSDAYEGMQKSFDLMARETAAMVRSMDQLRRDLRAQTKEGQM